MAAFDDGIDKLLNNDHRSHSLVPIEGDLRHELGIQDVGFIYRTTAPSWLDFAPGFVPYLVKGVTGPVVFNLLSVYLWVGLEALWIVLFIVARPRYAGLALLLSAAVGAGFIRLIGLDHVHPWLWLGPIAAVAVGIWLWTGEQDRVRGRVAFAVFALATALVGYSVHRTLSGDGSAVHLGPFPKGVPVNLLMNINPEAPIPNLLRAGAAVTRAILTIRRDKLIRDPKDGASGSKPPVSPQEQAANEQRALEIFEREAGQALLEASKCPDFVLDRGHWFGERLSPDEKRDLKAFLLTL